MKMKQNVSKSETILSSKHFFRFPRLQTKKNYFQILQPQTKKYFQISQLQTRHFHDQSLLSFFSADRLFRQQQVGHENETKCFEIRNNSFIQTFFQISSTPNKKKLFSNSSTPNKKIFSNFSTPDKAFP